ncbi:hypothetical protein AAMO2058_000629500 [Amorphochlora amoebiformis]
MSLSLTQIDRLLEPFPMSRKLAKGHEKWDKHGRKHYRRNQNVSSQMADCLNHKFDWRLYDPKTRYRKTTSQEESQKHVKFRGGENQLKKGSQKHGKFRGGENQLKKGIGEMSDNKHVVSNDPINHSKPKPKPKPKPSPTTPTTHQVKLSTSAANSDKPSNSLSNTGPQPSQFSQQGEGDDTALGLINIMPSSQQPNEAETRDEEIPQQKTSESLLERKKKIMEEKESLANARARNQAAVAAAMARRRRQQKLRKGDNRKIHYPRNVQFFEEQQKERRKRMNLIKKRWGVVKETRIIEEASEDLNTRVKANTWMTKLTGRPPFTLFGTKNTRPSIGGLSYGNYMVTHNTAPEIPPNIPDTPQVYSKVRQHVNKPRLLQNYLESRKSIPGRIDRRRALNTARGNSNRIIELGGSDSLHSDFKPPVELFDELRLGVGIHADDNEIFG